MHGDGRFHLLEDFLEHLGRHARPGEDRRVHGAGADRIEPDAATGEFCGQRPGQ